MQNQVEKTVAAVTKNYEERILVVRREYLFTQGAWQGLRQDGLDSMVRIVNEKGEYYQRSAMENDPTYKQIIPYLVFTHENRYFLMQRKASASEQRLKNKMSLGIGGHLREEDLRGRSIFDWARREFHEEVQYQGKVTIEPLGILNDDSDSVGQVHLGLVLLVKGDSPAISIKSELKQGCLVTLAECSLYQSEMESWSQLVFALLQKDGQDCE